nr:unnamed protein product [Digitaria exilis]
MRRTPRTRDTRRGQEERSGVCRGRNGGAAYRIDVRGRGTVLPLLFRWRRPPAEVGGGLAGVRELSASGVVEAVVDS